MQDSLVAINIKDNTTNKLLNPSLVPMLFYWNGQDDVVSELQKNTQFGKFLKEKITEINYTNIDIALFYFKYNEDNEEEYNEINKQLQDILHLSLFDSDEIILNYLVHHFYNLYKTSMKKEYNELDDTKEKNIINIYKEIKNKFGERISKITCINWVRSVLIDNDKLNNINTDYIINKLNNILNEID